MVSHDQRQRWCNRMPWLKQHSFTLWEGFPPSEFALETAKDPKTVLWVGKVTNDKGLQEFRQLAAWNPDWTFIIYGNPKPRNLGHNIQYRGELKRGKAHIRAFQRATKFFFFTKAEAFGRVFVEAISKGTPVLGSAAGSLPELIVPTVGVSSSDLRVLNASLHDYYNYTAIHEYAKSRFSSRHEVQQLYVRSRGLV